MGIVERWNRPWHPRAWHAGRSTSMPTTMHSISSTPSTADRASLVTTFGIPADIVDWARRSWNSQARRSGRSDPPALAQFDAAIALRENLYEVFGPIAGGGVPDPRALAAVTRRVPPRRCVLRSGSADGDGYEPQWPVMSVDVDLRPIGRRGGATAAFAVGRPGRLVRRVRLAVLRRVAGPRTTMVLDERMRRSRQDAPVPPTAERRRLDRTVAALSGSVSAIECALRRARTRTGRLVATVAAIADRGRRTDAGRRSGNGGRRPSAAARDRRGRPQRIAAFTVTTSPDQSPTAAEIADLNDKIDKRLQRRGFGPTIRTVEYRALAAGTVDQFGSPESTNSNSSLGSSMAHGRRVAMRSGARWSRWSLPPPNLSPSPHSPPDSPLGLTIVGTAVSTNDLLLNGQLRPLDGEMIVLADGVADASGLPDYELFRRTYGWQAPVVADQLRSTDVGPLLASVRSISSDPSLTACRIRSGGRSDVDHQPDADLRKPPRGADRRCARIVLRGRCAGRARRACRPPTNRRATATARCEWAGDLRVSCSRSVASGDRWGRRGCGRECAGGGVAREPRRARRAEHSRTVRSTAPS